MTATKPNRILFDEDSIFDQDLTDKLLDRYPDATWALKVTDELIFELTPTRRQEILEHYPCWFVNWVLDGKKREITHDYDPPWECSGTVLTKKMGRRRPSVLVPHAWRVDGRRANREPDGDIFVRIRVICRKF